MIERLLQLLARQAQPALALGVFAGILLPSLAALLRPLLTLTVIGILTVALLRLDWHRLRPALKHPRRLLWLVSWQLLLAPALVWLSIRGWHLGPGIQLSLILQSAAPPIGASAVFALMLGADAVLALLITVTTIILLPLTLTTLVLVLPGAGVHVDLLAFAVRVTVLVLMPFLLAGLVRVSLGEARLQRRPERLAGINVLLLMLFAIAVMDGVTARLLSQPAFIAELLGLACMMTVLLHLAGWLALAGSGQTAAVAAAVCSGNRNMGLMLAITAGSAGATFALYVAVAQIPMYFTPLVIGALVRRYQRR